MKLNREIYTQFFLHEEYTGEKIITWFRLFVSALVFFRLLVHKIFEIPFYGAAISSYSLWVFGVIFLGCFALFYDVRILYDRMRKWYRPYYKYAISTTDIAIFGYMGYFNLDLLSKKNIDNKLLAGFALLIFVAIVFLIFLTALRFSPFNTIYTTLLAVVAVYVLFVPYFQNIILLSSIAQLLIAGAITTTITVVIRNKIIKLHETALLERFLPKQLVEQISSQKHYVEAGGDLKKVAVLFSDIRGFTQFSEKRSPKEIVDYLNVYFSDMIEVVFRYKGTLDKFIGDAIMAVFGAPISSGTDVENAISTGLDMLKKLTDFNALMKTQGFEPIQIGIGIDFGEVVAGNIGNEHRLEYTVIGDIVNTASRVQSLNKEFGTHFLVTENAYQMAKDKFRFGEARESTIRGKSQPIKVYEVLGRA